MDETWASGLLRDRQVVPRWHDPKRSADLGERTSNILPRTWPARTLHWASKINDESDSIDIEEIKFVLGTKRGDEAQSNILHEKWRSIHQTVDTLPTHGVQNYQARIFRLRRSLGEHHDQALLWSELARQYTIAGLDKKAQHAMSVALHIAGGNTYLRRSASRMYLHFNEKQRALSLLRTFPKIRSAPQILAAEIAVSAATGKPSHYAGIARKIASEKAYNPRSLSEVNAAIGTLELENGKHKSARALFAQSLIDPTENALAQAQWATEHDARIVIPDAAWNTPNNYEASALRARKSLDWDTVLTASDAWLDDEPYSARPAALGSFACFSKAQNLAAESIATKALFSTPSSLALLNNRSVARSYLGKIEDSYRDILAALNGQDGPGDPHLLATLGLLAYRSNDTALGALCYGSALSWFIDQKSILSAVLASLYWIRETRHFDLKGAQQDLEFIKSNIGRMSKGQRDPEIASMINYLDAALRKDHALEEPYRQLPAGLDLGVLLDRFKIPVSAERRRDKYLHDLLPK